MSRCSLLVVLGLTACVAQGENPDEPKRFEDGEQDQAPGSPPTYWQDVEPLLRAFCYECHTSPPLYGAPMSLVSYRDLFQPSFSPPFKPIHETMIARLRGEGGRARMPPRGGITEQQIAMIAAWSAAGAPEGIAPAAPPLPAAGCDAGVNNPPPIDSGTTMPPAHDAGTEPPPPPVDAGTPPPPPPPEQTIEVVAPGAYIRTGTQDEYGCFRTIVRTNQPLHAFEIIPHVDQPTVVHHVLLFRDATRTYPEQKSGIFCALDTVGRDWELLHGWAPGGENMIVPPEAGIRIEDGEYLIVQIHYNNINGAPVTDRTGMRIRATPELRPNDAAVVGFGSESFSLPAGQTSVSRSGDCTIQRPMHVFSYSPHMHLLGRGARVELIRGGQTTLLADVTNFAFEAQITYPVSWDFQAGDIVRTTCTWDTSGRTQTTRFGEGTTDEMCYVFSAHYPPIGTFSCTP